MKNNMTKQLMNFFTRLKRLIKFMILAEFAVSCRITIISNRFNILKITDFDTKLLP